jgi:hypothetical protein
MATSLAQMRAELGAAMARSAPGLSTANELCTTCVALLGVDGAAISMVLDGASSGTFGSSGQASRRLDEHEFTFGQGPCLEAAATGEVVHAPDLDAVHEQRWPMFADAVLGDGIRAVFALPVKLTSACVGALDLYRTRPGPLGDDELAGGLLAAELAGLPVLTMMSHVVEDSVAEKTENTADAANGDAWAHLIEMDRMEVYQATGMLIAQLNVSAAEALVRLRAHALASGQTASEVAYAILGEGLQLERDGDDGHEGLRP